MFRKLTALVCSLMLLAAMTAAAKGLEDDDWILVETENFQIMSVLSKKETVELARYLEAFRVGVDMVANLATAEEPIPTRIYAMGGRSDFLDLGFDRKVAGVFMPRTRQNTIVIREVSGMSETEIMLHEYAHFLMRNRSLLVYPDWYDEGLAEFFGASKIRRGSLYMGLVPESRVYGLERSKWIHLRELLQPVDYDEWSLEKTSMFYGQSWALVHYLQMHEEWRERFTPSMSRYLKLIEDGESSIAAFETAFDVEVDEMNRQLRRYVERGKMGGIKVDLGTVLTDFEASVSPMSRADVSLALGGLALIRNKLELAENWFQIASREESTAARANAGLGDVRKFADQYSKALPYFERAVELAPDDPYCQLDMAEYWHDLALEPTESEQWLDHLAKAREHYIAAWKLDKTAPEVYAMYGKTYIDEGSDYARALELLEEAEFYLPSSLDIRYLLARTYAELGRTDEAIKAAKVVVAWSHEESDVSNRARRLIARLTGANADESPVENNGDGS